MGRLSTFAKNRILNLRFQKSFRIKQIAQEEIKYGVKCSILFNLFLVQKS